MCAAPNFKIEVYDPESLEKPGKPTPLVKLNPLSDRLAAKIDSLNQNLDANRGEISELLQNSQSYRPGSFSNAARKTEALRLYRDLYKETFEGELKDVYPETVVLAAGIAHQRSRDLDLPALIDRSDVINYLSGNYDDSETLQKTVEQYRINTLQKEAEELEKQREAKIHEAELERLRLEKLNAGQLPTPAIATTSVSDSDTQASQSLEDEISQAKTFATEKWGSAENAEDFSPTLSVESLSKYSLPLQLGAEFVGTFLVTLILIYAAAMSPFGFNASALSVLPLLTGAVYASGFFIFRNISGGFLNPAISLAMIVVKRISWSTGLLLAGVEFLAGILAGFTVKTLLPTTDSGTGGTISDMLMRYFATNGVGENTPLTHVGTFSQQAAFVTFSPLVGALFEFFAILIIAAVFMGIIKNKITTSGTLAIGFAYLVGTFFTNAASGTGLNPARSLGAALAGQDWAAESWDGTPMGDVWIFILVPIVGAAIVAAVVFAFGDDDLSAELESEEFDASEYLNYDADFLDDDDQNPGFTSSIATQTSFPSSLSATDGLNADSVPTYSTGTGSAATSNANYSTATFGTTAASSTTTGLATAGLATTAPATSTVTPTTLSDSNLTASSANSDSQIAASETDSANNSQSTGFFDRLRNRTKTSDTANPDSNSAASSSSSFTATTNPTSSNFGATSETETNPGTSSDPSGNSTASNFDQSSPNSEQ